MNELIEDVELTEAKKILQETGELQPTFIGYAKDKIIRIKGAWDDDKGKEGFLAFVSTAFACYEVNSYKTIIESWVSMIQDDSESNRAEGLKSGELRPACDPYRTEALVFMEATRDSQSMAMIPFVKNNGVITFQEATKPDRFEGAFAELLLPKGLKIPDDLREVTDRMLSRFGLIQLI